MMDQRRSGGNHTGLGDLADSGAVRAGSRRSSWRRVPTLMVGALGFVMYCIALFLPLRRHPFPELSGLPEPGIIDLTQQVPPGFWIANSSIWIVLLSIALVLLGSVYVLRRNLRMGRVLVLVGGLIGFALFGGHVPVSIYLDMEPGPGLWLGLIGSGFIVIAGMAIKKPLT